MLVNAFSGLRRKKWKSINTAQKKSATDKDKIRNSVFKNGIAPGNDIDLVVFGSVARNECTSKSDVDWTLLIDGPSKTDHDEIGRFVKKRLSEAKLIDPSPTGLFGQVTFSHDLIH